MTFALFATAVSSLHSRLSCCDDGPCDVQSVGAVHEAESLRDSERRMAYDVGLQR